MGNNSTSQDAGRSRGQRSFAQKFMDATGKLRMFFGPAESSSRDHEMTEENKRSLAEMQAQTEAQYETVRRPDGSTYLIPKRPDAGQ
ncbi:hypothetical protein [Arthrobacter sp. UM1]|uniref:hypothetical protein n=1 Tax=Arthrobacter sp. UM1 TaxID=2766776 RepID=UPI001CF71189|nr:hypothetical protein [Arthrobacter sp. UM1]MCB4208727.1 hypothetical protein [Arthrobacter sp. UM1]